MKKISKRLTSLELQGYKSIAYDAPLRLKFGSVNILLGANGAGKSNVVSFFKMLEQMARGSFQRFVAESGTNQIFLHYGAKKTPAISAAICFEGELGYEVYSFQLTSAVPDRLIISLEMIEWADYDSQKADLNHKVLISDFNESALISATDDLEKEMHNLIAGCKVYQFSDSSATSPMRLASTVESAHYLQSEANNLSSFLYYLKRNYSESYNRIVSYVREVVPQFKDFYLEPSGEYIALKWEDTSPNDYVLSAHQLSDGSIRFIALATLLLQPEQTMPRVIIIDEPELGLHPYAIDRLTEMIKDASLHSQVIVATQSPALIDGFSPDDVTIIEYDAYKQSTIARKLNSTDYKEWLDEYTLSELWDKNIIGGRPI
ncbi:MAG: AAA family ATPase [Muribaculaceae bacterium]|nr:AAA family ATPase [Muribaculaceae bacterium]